VTDRAPAVVSFDWKDLAADLDRLLCWADGVGADTVSFWRNDYVHVRFPGEARRIVSGRLVPNGALVGLEKRMPLVARESADDAREGRRTPRLLGRQRANTAWYDALSADGGHVFHHAAHRARRTCWRVVFAARPERRTLDGIGFLHRRRDDVPHPAEASRD